MNIDGRIAVVTGAGSGLGAATAKLLADAGAKVVAVDRDAAAAARTANSLDGVAMELDVSDASGAENSIADMAARHGSPSILVNCAGVAPAAKIAGRNGAMALDAFSGVININLIGTFNMMRLIAVLMQKAEPNDDGERGVIVNTASVAAFEGQIGQAAYAASKGGIASLTLPAAREFASSGIRVMAIAPGLFGTPLLLNMPQNVQDSLAATVPFPQRFGTAEEFALLVKHICENPMLNGEVIRLDGALRMAAR